MDELAEEALKAGKETFEIERINYDGDKILETFDANTKKYLRRTTFYGDGRTIRYKYDYDPKTGRELKREYFNETGKLDFMSELNSETGFYKNKYFNADGKVYRIEDYDPKFDRVIDEVVFEDLKPFEDFIEMGQINIL